MKRIFLCLLLILLCLGCLAHAEDMPDGFMPESVVAERGSRGELVRCVQERLIALDYLTDDADAVFGKKTAAALSAWQAAQGYEATGRLTAAQFRELCPDGLGGAYDGFDGAPGYEVYISPAGEKYHRYDCYTIREHPVKGMSEAQAEAEGYKPCLICKPDR